MAKRRLGGEKRRGFQEFFDGVLKRGFQGELNKGFLKGI